MMMYRLIKMRGCLYDSVLQNSWKDLIAVNPHIKHPNGIKIKALILTFDLEKRDQCSLGYFTIRGCFNKHSKPSKQSASAFREDQCIRTTIVCIRTIRSGKQG